MKSTNPFLSWKLGPNCFLYNFILTQRTHAKTNHYVFSNTKDYPKTRDITKITVCLPVFPIYTSFSFRLYFHKPNNHNRKFLKSFNSFSTMIVLSTKFRIHWLYLLQRSKTPLTKKRWGSWIWHQTACDDKVVVLKIW